MCFLQLIVLGVLLGLGVGWWLYCDMDELVVDMLLEVLLMVVVVLVMELVVLGVIVLFVFIVLLVVQILDVLFGLLLLVQGILFLQLCDIFIDVCSEGCVYDVIDIMVDVGMLVLVVVDGMVEKLFDSECGGLMIYQFEFSGCWCYYYVYL